MTKSENKVNHNSPSEISTYETIVNSKKLFSTIPINFDVEESLGSIWVQLINVLFDENQKTSLKDLMSSKKFRYQSYVDSSLEATNDEENIDDNSVIDLDSKEFKQKLWECLFWSAGMEGLDAYILRFLVGR